MANGKKTTETGSGYKPANKYEGLDYRFYANVLYDGAQYNGHTMDIHYEYDENGELQPGVDLVKYGSSQSAAVTVTGYYLAKFRNEKQTIDTDPTYASSQNYIIWRYAELLLDYAEAQYNLGNTGVALEYVNKIRSRAKVNEWTSMTMDDLLNERRIELAFEETTYWDILRKGEGVEKLSYQTPIKGIEIIKEQDGSFTYNTVNVHNSENLVRSFSDHQHFFVIPWDEIRFQGIEQNPGYIEY